MANMGWSMPAGCSGDPAGDVDPLCDLCGRPCSSCECPECPHCGEAGNRECYVNSSKRFDALEAVAEAARSARDVIRHIVDGGPCPCGSAESALNNLDTTLDALDGEAKIPS